MVERLKVFRVFSRQSQITFKISEWNSSQHTPEPIVPKANCSSFLSQFALLFWSLFNWLILVSLLLTLSPQQLVLILCLTACIATIFFQVKYVNRTVLNLPTHQDWSSLPLKFKTSFIHEQCFLLGVVTGKLAQLLKRCFSLWHHFL